MKTLMLLRHAKAEVLEPGQSDRARILRKRGRKDAKTLGKFLYQRGLIPDLIVASPSVRTTQTAELVADQVGVPVTAIHYVPRIYEADPQGLLEVIQQIDDKHHSVLLVGHNPGLEELLQKLIGGPFIFLPTTGFALLSCASLTWGTLSQHPTGLNILLA